MPCIHSQAADYCRGTPQISFKEGHHLVVRIIRSVISFQSRWTVVLNTMDELFSFNQWCDGKKELRGHLRFSIFHETYRYGTIVVFVFELNRDTKRQLKMADVK